LLSLGSSFFSRQGPGVQDGEAETVYLNLEESVNGERVGVREEREGDKSAQKFSDKSVEALVILSSTSPLNTS
jgi:hypothetical protein